MLTMEHKNALFLPVCEYRLPTPTPPTHTHTHTNTHTHVCHLANCNTEDDYFKVMICTICYCSHRKVTRQPSTMTCWRRKYILTSGHDIILLMVLWRCAWKCVENQFCSVFVFVTSGRWQCYTAVLTVCVCDFREVTVLHNCWMFVCDFREVTVLHNCVDCVCDFREVTVLHNCWMCVTSGRWQCYTTVLTVCVWLQGGDSVT